MYDTVMTCNECQAQCNYITTEWPPKICVCNDCGQVYKIAMEMKTGRVYFEMVPHRI